MKVKYVANMYYKTISEVLVDEDGFVYFNGNKLDPCIDNKGDARIDIPISVRIKYDLPENIKLKRLIYESITHRSEMRGRTNVQLIDESNPLDCRYDNLEDTLNKFEDFQYYDQSILEQLQREKVIFRKA